MKHFELTIPEDELIELDQDFSIQSIGHYNLPIYNATKYAEAIDLVKASARGIAISEPEQNIKDAKKVAKAGRGSLTAILINNKTAKPGSPSSVIGYIRPEIVEARFYSLNFSSPLKKYHSIYFPSIGSGAEITEDIDLCQEDRYLLKLRMIRFAIKSFMKDPTGDNYTASRTLRVDPLPGDNLSNIIFNQLGITEGKFEESIKNESGVWQEPKKPKIIYMNTIHSKIEKLINE